MFETSPGLTRALPSGRAHYNETILENSQEQDSPASAGQALESVSDPAEAMRLLLKSPAIVKVGNGGLNLVNIAGEMELVTFRKGDMIVDLGDLNNNFYILQKGTLKITEYEVDESPSDPEHDRTINRVHYVSEEGHSFFGDIWDVKGATQSASVEAMDERCELYMLEGSKREALKENDMAKMIHKVLNMPEQEKAACRGVHPGRQTFFFEDGIQLTSDFDSGNAQLCMLSSKAGQETYDFDVWLQSDAHPYIPAVNDGRVAFFFAVTGVPPDGQESQKRKLKFNLKNVSEPRKRMGSGYSPVYLEVSSQRYHDLVAGKVPFHRQKWKRVPGGVKFPDQDVNPEATFQFTLSPNFKSTDYVFFAYSHPYTYNDMKSSI